MAAEKIKTNIFKIEKNKSWLVLLKSSHVLKLSLGFWLLIFSWAGSGAFYPVNKWRKLPYKSSPLLIGIRLKIDRFQKRFHGHGMAFQTSCQNKCSGICSFSSLKLIHISKVIIDQQQNCTKEFSHMCRSLPKGNCACWGGILSQLSLGRCLATAGIYANYRVWARESHSLTPRH